MATVMMITACSFQKKVAINSPDGMISFEIVPASNGSEYSIAQFSLTSGSKKVLLPSSLYLNMKAINVKNKFKIISTENETITKKWINTFGEKKDVPDNYNQVKIFLESADLNINLVCRVYNEGVAFAYEFPEQGRRDSVTIKDEKILFRFPADYIAWSASRAQSSYTRVTLSTIEKGCERPLVIEYDRTLTIALTEAKLVDYTRLKFEPDSSGGVLRKSSLKVEFRTSIHFHSP